MIPGRHGPQRAAASIGLFRCRHAYSLKSSALPSCISSGLGPSTRRQYTNLLTRRLKPGKACRSGVHGTSSTSSTRQNTTSSWWHAPPRSKATCDIITRAPSGNLSRASSTNIVRKIRVEGGSSTIVSDFDQVSRFRSRFSAEAAILYDHDAGGVRLVLQQLDTKLLSLSNEETSTESEQEGRVVNDLEVIPNRHLEAMKVAAARRQDDEARNRAREWTMRSEAGNATWISVLQELENWTTASQTNQVVLKICGPLDTLAEFYYTILSDSTYKVIADYPIVSQPTCFMLMAGTTKSLDDVVELLTTDEEWNVLKVEDDHSGYRSNTSSNGYPIVQAAPSRRAPQELDFVIPLRSWTKASFADHVHAVIRSRPPRILRGTIPHKDIVAKVVWELFNDIPNVKQVLSWVAIHNALTYLVKHKMHRSAAELMRRMELQGFPPVVETFNIFLRGCAAEQNLVAFAYHLKLMLTSGVRPNESTWIALMVAAPTLEAQQSIARQMFRRGFVVRPAFARENAPQVIPYSFGPFLDAGGLTTEYIATMDDLYGPGWLTAEAASNIAQALAIRGRVLEAIQLVDDLHRLRNLTPVRPVLHALLEYCKLDTNADLAIWLYIYAFKHWKVTDWNDTIILRQMFQIAWSSRMFNFVRVIWKYLCISGTATFRQQRRIRNSLIARLQPSDRKSHENWKVAIGPVACGIDPLGSQAVTPASIMNAERRLFGVHPSGDFSLRLLQALMLDKEWTQGAVKAKRGVTWKIQNAVRVPLAPNYLARLSSIPKRSSVLLRKVHAKLGSTSGRTASTRSSKAYRIFRQKQHGTANVLQNVQVL